MLDKYLDDLAKQASAQAETRRHIETLDIQDLARLAGVKLAERVPAALEQVWKKYLPHMIGGGAVLGGGIGAATAPEGERLQRALIGAGLGSALGPAGVVGGTLAGGIGTVAALNALERLGLRKAPASRAAVAKDATRVLQGAATGLGIGGIGLPAAAGYAAGRVGAGEEKTSAKHDMPPFTSQDRPEKVKEIYRALKRDHPDMPAEVKARIASRKGKASPKSRKPPETGGPAYKAPLHFKRKGESYVKKASKMSQERRESLPAKQFAVPETKAKKIGVASEIKGEAKGKYPIPDAAHARNALARVSAHGTPEEKSMVRSKVHAKFPEIGKEASDIRTSPRTKLPDAASFNRKSSAPKRNTKEAAASCSGAKPMTKKMKKTAGYQEKVASALVELIEACGGDPVKVASALEAQGISKEALNPILSAIGKGAKGIWGAATKAKGAPSLGTAASQALSGVGKGFSQYGGQLSRAYTSGAAKGGFLGGLGSVAKKSPGLVAGAAAVPAFAAGRMSKEGEALFEVGDAAGRVLAKTGAATGSVAKLLTRSPLSSALGAGAGALGTGALLYAGYKGLKGAVREGVREGQKTAAVGMPPVSPEELQESVEEAQAREDIPGRAKAWQIGGGIGGGLLGAAPGALIAGLTKHRLGGGIGAGLGALGGAYLGQRFGRAHGEEEAAADKAISMLRALRAHQIGAQMGAQHGYMAGLQQGMGEGKTAGVVQKILQKVPGTKPWTKAKIGLERSQHLAAQNAAREAAYKARGV